MKFKHDKLRALAQWQRNEFVSVWLWNQPLDDWRQLPVLDLIALCKVDGHRSALREDGVFDGHKPYSAVPWIELI